MFYEVFGLKNNVGTFSGRCVHYTPKHGSWLNQAEIAISLFSRQCLGKRRIGDRVSLRKETRALESSYESRSSYESNGNLLARKPDGSLATKSRGHATSALNAPQPTEMYLILFEQNRQSVSRISGFSSFVTFRGKDRRHSVQVITM